MEQNLFNLLHSAINLKQLKQLHSLIVTTQQLRVISSFVKRLLDLSYLDYAREVFDQIPKPDQDLRNTVISSYSKHSMYKEAIEQFISMRYETVYFDFYTIPPIIRACSSLVDVGLGKQVHSLVLNSGFGSSIHVQTALVDFYSKSGDLDAARRVFDEILVKDPVCYNCLISGYSKRGDVVTARKLFDEMEKRTLRSWNVILSCYSQNGNYLEGFMIFEQMLAEGCHPNECTLATVLSLCAKLGNLEFGLRVKKLIDEKNWNMNIIVSTALIEMHAKCGAVDEARREFDRMPKKDVVVWSTMINGYAQNGRSTEAVDLFEKMRSENITPSTFTLVGVLSSCAQLGSVEIGERIGNYVEKFHDFLSDSHLASALLTMYSRCGNIMKAQQVFDRVPQKDEVIWNSMIMGLAVNGFAEEAIAHYFKMRGTNIKADEITFVALLTACTHSGQVELGLGLFKSMKLEHGLLPQIEHYTCVVDLYCRSGKLREAYDFVCKMEVEPGAAIWGSILSASRINLNIELAEIAVSKLAELEPENSGNYVLLANMYASLGRWREASKVRSLMKDKSIQKMAAYSWIELENKVHKFLVGDLYHPESKEVCKTVDTLALHANLVCQDYVFELNF